MPPHPDRVRRNYCDHIDRFQAVDNENNQKFIWYCPTCSNKEPVLKSAKKNE